MSKQKIFLLKIVFALFYKLVKIDSKEKVNQRWLTL